MKNGNGDLYDDKGKKTRKHTALLICGHNSENKYKSGGETDELLAPNGNKSNLNSEQYRLVRTQEFINWFGDWVNTPDKASKVVDDNGEPLVVYHGSSVRFNEFKSSSLGELGRGIYFTLKKSEAQEYADRGNSDEATVYSVFLKIKNPFIAKKGAEQFWVKFGGSGVSDEQATRNLISQNYDGVILDAPETKYDPFLRKVVKTNFQRRNILVLDPKQIKLADGSNTAFDSNTSDIRFEDGGEVAYSGLLKQAQEAKDIEDFLHSIISDYDLRYKNRKAASFLVKSSPTSYIDSIKPYQAIEKDVVSNWQQRIQNGERPFVIIRTNNTIDGHHKLDAYKKSGFTDVPVLYESDLIDFYNKNAKGKITFDNFYENTSANFELVGGPTNWPVKKPTYISDHGSKYWHIGNYVYRLSDHWGEFNGGCTWLIEGYPYNAVEPIMGRAKLSEFKHKQVMAKGGNVGGTYQSKVDANLVHMGTEAADWKAVPIIGFQEVDMDHGKTRSMPIFDFSVMKGFTSPDTLYPATSGGFKDAMTNCELCGHNIKNVYHIYDAKHKYKLHVGSECVTHFQDGKSGKDKEREAKVMIALMLDKDLEALGGIVRQDLSRVRTERTFHGGTKNVREWHTLNIGYYTEGKSRGEYEIKVGEAVSKIDFDILKPKRFEYTKTINGKDIYDSIKPFSYDYEMERVSDGEGTKESVDKKLLSWFSRNEVMQVAVIKAAVGLLQAFEYPVDFSSDYLNLEEINQEQTHS